MTKQEKIIEEIAKLHGESMFRDYFYSDYVTEAGRVSCRNWARELVAYLHSQRLVIQVDRELPNKEAVWDYRGRPEVYDDVKQSMLEAGYVAVEPLIKE